MRRSILYQLGARIGERFDVLLDQVRLADELGLDAVWCFPASDDEGRFRGSAPEIWLSALASRTERIRLGWGMVEMTPPPSPPLRVAEQAAALDLASEGRLEVAFLPDGELPAESEERPEHGWAEGIRMLVDMWDAPSFSWTSPRFEVAPVDVVPKPHQRPHPPLLLAGWSVAHATRAGAAGQGFLDVSGGTDEVLEVHRDAYTEARAGADPHDLVCTFTYAVVGDLESDQAGRDRLVAWEELGIDEAVIRLDVDDPVDWGKDRIRSLAVDDAQLH